MLGAADTNSKAKKTSQLCGLLAGAIGAVGLTGWILDMPVLQRIHPALVTMKANTAIALLLACTSLLLQQDEKVRGVKRWLAQACGAVVALLGVLTLGEHVFGWDLGIDQALFRESLAAAGASFPGRMGVASTVVMICIGTALMTLDSRLRGRYWAPKFAVMAAVATTLVFLYYFYGIEQGEAISKYATIALHTVPAFYALCMGIFFARPHRGVMLELLGPGMGSIVARRMLPAAIFVPILLGWLRTLGRQAGMFGAGFGTAAFVVLIIMLFTLLIRWTVMAVNRLEGERRRSEAALRRSEADLRDFVENAAVGMHWVGPDGLITWANKAELKMLGYAEEEYIGHAVAEFHADAAVIADILKRLGRGEALAEYPASLRCKDGSIREVLISSNVRIEEDRFVHTRCFTRDITESRRAEKALRESEERFRALVTATSDVVYRLSPDWSEMHELGGRDFVMESAEPNRGWLQKYIQPNDQPEVEEAIRDAIRTKRIFEMEHQVQREDGSFGWAFTRAIPLVGADGEIVEWFGTMSDETARRQAEEAKRESENRKSAILDSSLDAIITMDHEGRVVDFNPAAERTFGMRAEDVVGHEMAEKIVPERLRARHHEGVAHYLASGEGPLLNRRIEVPALHADGHEFIVELSITRIAGTEPPMFTATLRDITDRQKAETDLRESEERFRVMADNIVQLAWMADAEGRFFWFNKRWFDYTGLTPETMKDRGWERVHDPRELTRVWEWWHECVANGTLWEDTFPLRGADGEFRWFLSRAVPVRDENGKVVRWFGTNTDVHEQRQISDALAQAKERAEAASRAKDEFLATLSHELRTPLTPVLMMATALGEEPVMTPAMREQLAMMRRNIELEARLIDDLLDLTRINRGKLTIEPVTADVHQLLSYTAEIVLSDRLGKDVSIVFKPEAVQHHALADATRLQQVFWNLIKNAIKFTPAGGSILVSTRNDAEERIILSVEDTGIGISAEALPRIFEAFEQGDAAGQHRYGGLGLGLAISKAIMEAHGGSIAVASEGPGRGAVFTVVLKSVPAPVSPVQDNAVFSGAARGLRLLVVEDHETTRAVLAQLLSRRGHVVTTAGSKQEALSIYGDGIYDAVISDLGLPDGSGLELMREIQRLRPVPAIALSGYGMEDDLRLSKEAGFFAHLVKPVNLDQLRHLIEQIAAGVVQGGGE
jgi:PAS domain S-box-containing protein